MGAKDRKNLNILAEALLVVSQMTQCIVLTVQCIYLRINRGLPILLSTRDKRVAVTFHKNQRFNLRNQYHEDATKVTPRIIEKFEEPLIIPVIPQQNDETLKKQQTKYPKIVEALDRILT